MASRIDGPGRDASTPTTGNGAASSTPMLFSTPYEANFSAVWCRKASVGTTTSRRGVPAAMALAIMTSVFPVPVGITTTAGTLERVQCAAMACNAPIWGSRKPG